MLRKPLVWLIPASIALALGAVVLHSRWFPIGEIAIKKNGSDLSSDEADSDADIFVDVTAYLTGWVKAPANILIDQRDPKTPNKLSKATWVPSLAYAVTHPDLGIAVLDTGLRAGQCDYGFQPIYWVPCRNERGADLISQLKSEGVEPDDIRFIIPSHFHGDHISGLESLLAYTNATVLMTQASLDDIKSPLRVADGIPSSMLSSDMRVEIIDEEFREDQIGVDVYDVYGDGTLRLFPTPGHTDGHISALARGLRGDILFTFDASHLEANLQLQIPSGAVSSKEDAIKSLQRLSLLDDELTALQIVYGHEPKQWACAENSVALFGSRDPCTEN